MKHIKGFLTLFIILTTLHAQEPEKPYEMIIFVHGTLKPVEFSIASIVKVMRNKIENSIYSRASKYLRNDPIFYQAQAMQQLGLHQITPENVSSKGAECLVNLFEKQYQFLENQNHKRVYYTFGWNGLLSETKRYQAAKLFYKALTKEVEKYAAHNVTPLISIVSFSHGANVTLNLAAVKDDDPTLKKNAFTVNTLVMLGAPIQRATDYLVSDPIFETVFHLYSTQDQIQTLDIFAPRQFFSGKRFSQRSKFKIPSKVTQVRVRTTDRIKRTNRVTIPEDSYEILNNKQVRLIHKDPGHTELWNFKWGAHWYRDNFPLNPLPFVSFVPSMLHALRKYMPEKRNVTFDYAVAQSGALLTPKLKKHRQAVPILDHATTQHLYDLAQNFVPKGFSIEKRREKVKKILDKARCEIYKTKCPRTSRLLMSYGSRRYQKRSNLFP